ncbi:MAG TPA: hypothetical protein VJT75_02335 [Thermoleophilaceae bacterium]|nr:hypothetical protein [Thermoleophilaceae bacterium]
MAIEDLTMPRYTAPPSPPGGRFTVLTALRRHFLIALIPVVLLVGAAVAYGLNREPTYTSEARLNVGGLNLTQQSVEGYVTAVQALAVAYSRAIDAEGVVRPVARKARRTPLYVVQHVGATPIQGSPVVRVVAVGKDSAEVVRLADLSADSLVDYAIKLNAGRAASKEMLKRFHAASRRLQRINVKRDRAAKRKNSEALASLQTQSNSADLLMRTAGILYQQSQQGQAMTELVQKLAPAGRPTSDRDSELQKYVAGAALAGLLIGVGLAVARANSLARRRLGER